MKRNLTIHTDGFEGFRKRSLERARKLDQNEPIEPEVSITVDETTIKALTGARMELFKTVRKKGSSITALAEVLNRSREAVSRDVKALAAVGLLKLTEVPNPGHGVVTMVEPAADRILIEL